MICAACAQPAIQTMQAEYHSASGAQFSTDFCSVECRRAFERNHLHNGYLDPAEPGVEKAMARGAVNPNGPPPRDRKAILLDLGRQVAELVSEKNAAYGDSFFRTGDFMRMMYPSGVAVGQLDDALALIRVLDKLFRIATSKTAFAEDPWRDIAGYALLSLMRDALTA